MKLSKDNKKRQMAIGNALESGKSVRKLLAGFIAATAAIVSGCRPGRGGGVPMGSYPNTTDQSNSCSEKPVKRSAMPMGKYLIPPEEDRASDDKATEPKTSDKEPSTPKPAQKK